MARHGRKPLAAAIAVAALCLAIVTVHLHPGTGTHALTHVFARTGSERPSGPARQQIQPNALGATGWMLDKDDLATPGTNHPGGTSKGSGTTGGGPGAPDSGATAQGAATPGTTAQGAAAPGTAAPRTVPGTEPAGSKARAAHSEPTAAPTHPNSPSGSSPGTYRNAAAPNCPPIGAGILSKAPGTGRTIALTFDDGPGPQTPAVLNVLAAQHVHATFFVIGKAVAAAPATVTRTAAEGHLVGNHSWDHAYPWAVPHGWTTSYLREQISRTTTAVTGATGRPTCFFRPPGGNMPRSVRVVAPRLRQQITLWSVDPQDWAIQGSRNPGPAGRAREANQIYRAAIAGTAQAHPVLLLHDSGGYREATVAALPQIITYYKAHGYRFVRLDGRP